MYCINIRINFLMVIFSLFMVMNANSAESTAPIAVASSAPGPEATISEKAGRSAYFLFFNGSGNYLYAEKNPFVGLPRKAGPKVATYLSDRGVALFVAGEFGDNMVRALNSYKIKYISQTGIAHEVVQAITQ